LRFTARIYCERTAPYVALPFVPTLSAGIVGLLLHPVRHWRTRRRLTCPETQPKGHPFRRCKTQGSFQIRTIFGSWRRAVMQGRSNLADVVRCNGPSRFGGNETPINNSIILPETGGFLKEPEAIN